MVWNLRGAHVSLWSIGRRGQLQLKRNQCTGSWAGRYQEGKDEETRACLLLRKPSGHWHDHQEGRVTALGLTRNQVAPNAHRHFKTTKSPCSPAQICSWVHVPYSFCQGGSLYGETQLYPATCTSRKSPFKDFHECDAEILTYTTKKRIWWRASMKQGGDLLRRNNASNLSAGIKRHT